MYFAGMFLHDVRKEIVQQLSTVYDSDETKAITNELILFYVGAENSAITPSIITQLQHAVSRLLHHEPLQYVLGEAWFYNLPFFVNNQVLIPRPETEELVDLIIREYQIPNNHEQLFSVLDIGTGSGCIPIALKKNCPNAHVYAMDISENALLLAAKNAERNKVDITFFQGDILSSNLQSPISNFQLIVSNPPYITQFEKAEMASNVLLHEPHLALFVSDGNPFQFYETIAAFAANNLAIGGKLYVEINSVYGMGVKVCMEKYGFKDVVIIKDMSGNDRIVKGILYVS